MSSEAVSVVCAYASEDSELRDALAKHLASLREEKLISDWYVGDILAGSDREKEILNQLNKADLVLLLISSDFLMSDFFEANKLATAYERHNKDEARVIPIIVRKVVRSGYLFDKFKVLPTNGKAVKIWDDEDAAWTDVTEGIRKVAIAFRDNRKKKSEDQPTTLPLNVQSQLDRCLQIESREVKESIDKYRKEVRQLLENNLKTNGGKFYPLDHAILNSLRIYYKLTSIEAEAIKQTELLHYENKYSKLDLYESVLIEAMYLQYPLGDSARGQMQQLQGKLGLSYDQALQIEKALEKNLRSRKGIDYRKLLYLLYKGEWKAADRETFKLIVGKADHIDGFNLKYFERIDLSTIDNLWVKYSKGKFGFSVQREIYINCGGKPGNDKPSDTLLEKFGDQIGWYLDDKWISYDALTFNTSAPRGHLPRKYIYPSEGLNNSWKKYSSNTELLYTLLSRIGDIESNK